MKERLATGGGIVVYFNLADKEMARWYYPSEKELKKRLSLSLVKELSDGAVYQ